MRKTNHQKGFTVMELLLILLAVVLVVFAGIYITQKRHPAVDSNTPVVTSHKTATVAGSRAAAIANRLLKATAGQEQNKIAYVNNHVSTGDFTPAFKAAVDAGTALPNEDASPVACTNGIMPDSFGAGATKLTGDVATVYLSAMKAGQNITAGYGNTPQLTLKYANNNWAVDQYNCVSNPNYKG